MTCIARSTLALAAALAAVTAAGCTTPEPAPPREFQTREQLLWGSDVQTEMSDTGRVFIVTEVIDIRDTLENAQRDVLLAARRRAVEAETREALRNHDRLDALQSSSQLLERRIFAQPQLYLAQQLVLERQRFPAENKVGVKLKAWVDRNRIEQVLTEDGLIRGDRDRLQVIVYARPKADMERELAEDLQDTIAEVFNNRGFDATTWDEVLTDIAEDRNAEDESTRALFERFVDDPEFVANDRFEGALTVLRGYGRLLVTYNVAVAKIERGVVSVLLEARMRDLLTRRVVATEQKEATDPAPPHKDSRVVLKTALAAAARTLATRFVEKAHDFHDQQLKKTRGGDVLTLVFEGYSDEELVRLERILQETFDQSGGLALDAEGRPAAEVTYTQKTPAYYKRQLLRRFEQTGLASAPPPLGEPDQLVFRKKR